MNLIQVSRCWPGFIEADGSCFMVSEERLAWTAAEGRCRMDGIHLATITSDAQQHAVMSLVESASERLWIGYTDAAREGSWTRLPI